MYEKSKYDQTVTYDSFELAGLGARIGASIIDGILLFLAAILLLVILSTGSATLMQFFGLALSVVYHWIFWTRRDGQTPGKMAVGIRVVKADGSELSGSDAFIRAIGYHVSSLFLGLGYIWAIFDGNNQTWHDKMAGTYVVLA